MHAARAPPGLTRSTLVPVCAKRARPLHAPTSPSLSAYVALAAQGWPLFLLSALWVLRSTCANQLVELCCHWRHVCVVSVEFCPPLCPILTPTLSRQGVRLTSGVVCKIRAFSVLASQICRARQLASSFLFQGLCVVFCGLKNVGSYSRRREGGVSKGGSGLPLLSPRWLAAAERRSGKNSRTAAGGQFLNLNT